MALIKCTKCGNDIHDNDTRCLICGLDVEMIKYELKRRELVEQGKIRPNGKKNIVVFFELVLIISLIFIYIKLFIPTIIDMTENEKDKKIINNCEKQGGTWDKESEVCIYDN